MALARTRAALALGLIAAALLVGGALWWTRVADSEALGTVDAGVVRGTEDDAELTRSSAPDMVAPEASGSSDIPTRVVRPGVRLPGPGRLSGVVLERSSGAGVAGLSVELFAVPPASATILKRVIGVSGLGDDVQRRTEPIAVTLTGPLGQFAFEGVREGTWYVDVLGDHHLAESPVRARTVASGSGGPIEVWVRAGGRVYGRVLEPDGSPARTARVLMTTGASTFLTAAASGDVRAHETETDETGGFAFPAVPPGVGYEVSAIADTFAVTHVLGVDVRAGQDTEVVIHGRRGATITGRIVSVAGEQEDGAAEGVALEGARVGAVSRGLRNLRFAKEILERTHAVTDEGGNYVLRGVPPGEVDVIAMADRHVPGKGPRVHAAERGVHEADEFELVRGPLVSGRVIDAAGAPIAGVLVRWSLADIDAFRRSLTLAPLLAQAMREFDFPRTDADGRFTAGAFPGDAPYVLHFDAAGYSYVREEWDPAEDPAEIEVVLLRGGVAEGIVMDLEKSAPVTSYTISTTDRVETQLDAPGRLNPFSGGLEVEDEGGRFRIDQLCPGDVRLRFSAEGYISGEAEVTVTPNEVTRGVIVMLTRGATLAGVVQDPEGKPIAGAQVTTDSGMDFFLDRVQERRDELRATYADGRPAPRGGPDRAFARFAASLGLMGGLAVTTDADGAFEIDGLPGGSYRVIALHRDFRASTAAQVTVEAGQRRDGIIVEMSPGGGVFGRATDRFDRPIEEGIVLAVSPGAFKATGAGRALYQGRTDANGEYEIRHMEAGGYFFLLTRGDAELTPMSFLGTLNLGMVTVPEDRLVRHDIVDTSSGACRVHGKVTDRGEPLTRGSIVAMGFESENFVGVDVKVTDIHGDGTYAFEGLPPGEYRFRVVGNGPRTNLWVEIPDAPEMLLDLALPGGAIAGRVTDAATGEAVFRAEVVLRPRGRASSDSLVGQLIDRDGGRQSFRTAPDGSYRFERLEGGEYEVSASAPRRRESPLAPMGPALVELFSSEAREDLDFPLAPGLELTGTVTDDGGTGVEGARVTATRRGGAVTRRPITDTTDVSGEFALTSLAPGNWVVTASAPGFARARSDVELVPGANEALRLSLERGVDVTVVVVDASGAPVAGAAARLVAEGGSADEDVGDPGSLFTKFFAGEATTDAEGELALGTFAAGKYELRVTRGTRRTKDLVTLPAGRPGARVELHATLR
ncbi:MAG: hypothetical protein GY711_22095 [bacterium]|nr:hypothetical protein [bacterium]